MKRESGRPSLWESHDYNFFFYPGDRFLVLDGRSLCNGSTEKVMLLPHCQFPSGNLFFFSQFFTIVHCSIFRPPRIGEYADILPITFSAQPEYAAFKRNTPSFAETRDLDDRFAIPCNIYHINLIAIRRNILKTPFYWLSWCAVVAEVTLC